jgi:Ankyrin repeats (3 copies)
MDSSEHLSTRDHYNIVPPQVFLDTLLTTRGYATRKYNTLETSYYQDPTPYQEACYTTYMVNIVKNNDFDQLRRLLLCGVLSFNPCNYYGESLVHLACRLGRYDIMCVMVELWGKFIVQISDDYGRNPLHDACWAVELSFPVIKLLLDADTHLLHLADSRGATPLSYVSRENWAEWVCFIDDHKDVYWPIIDRHEQQVPLVVLSEDRHQRDRHHVSSKTIELAHWLAMGMVAPEAAVSLHSKEKRFQKHFRHHEENLNDSFHSALTSSSYEYDGNSESDDFSDDDCSDDSSSSSSSSGRSYMNEDEMEEMLLRIQARKKQGNQRLASVPRPSAKHHFDITVKVRNVEVGIEEEKN